MEIVILLIAAVLIFSFIKTNKPKNSDNIKQANTIKKTNIKLNENRNEDNEAYWKVTKSDSTGMISNYIGRRVFHKHYGYGNILSIDNNYIDITFEDKERTATFPISIIQNYELLNLVDNNDKYHMRETLEDRSSNKKSHNTDFNREKIDNDHQTDFNFMDKFNNKNEEKKLSYVKSDKKIRYFIVFQNKTYDQEREEGILWAPKYNAGGRELFHWSNVKKVKPNDIVFSIFNRKIVSVNIATGKYYDSAIPKTFDEELWDKEGWSVNLNYHKLYSEIEIESIMHELQPLLPSKYSPFSESGRGNQGYLYQVPEEAGRYLLDIVKNNNSRLDIF